MLNPGPDSVSFILDAVAARCGLSCSDGSQGHGPSARNGHSSHFGDGKAFSCVTLSGPHNNSGRKVSFLYPFYRCDLPNVIQVEFSVWDPETQPLAPTSSLSQGTPAGQVAMGPCTGTASVPAHVSHLHTALGVGESRSTRQTGWRRRATGRPPPVARTGHLPLPVTPSPIHSPPRQTWAPQNVSHAQATSPTCQDEGVTTGCRKVVRHQGSVRPRGAERGPLCSFDKLLARHHPPEETPRRPGAGLAAPDGVFLTADHRVGIYSCCVLSPAAAGEKPYKDKQLLERALELLPGAGCAGGARLSKTGT